MARATFLFLALLTLFFLAWTNLRSPPPHKSSPSLPRTFASGPSPYFPPVPVPAPAPESHPPSPAPAPAPGSAPAPSQGGPSPPPAPAPLTPPAPSPTFPPATCDGKAMGIYPDLSDPTCRKFYRCQPIGPGGVSIKIDMVCPPGTVFDPIMYCVPPKLLPPGARCSLKRDANV